MIKVIPPSQYKTALWKNGKGKTTELAISNGGCFDNFDWRLSIASVGEDGPFSDFSGYKRNLILLEGQGIKLLHDDHQDLLIKPLSISSFDGSNKTTGQLINGPIKDFNLMTKQDLYQVQVETYLDHINISKTAKELCFVYSHHSNISIYSNSEKTPVSSNHLAIVYNQANIKIVGEKIIIINLKKNQ